MAEFKFPCQACGQHIQCDEQWSGRQIACPVCGAPIVVPQFHVTPTAAPAPRVQPAVATPPAPAPRNLVPKPKPFPVKKVVIWSAASIVFLIGAFFLLKQADVLQGAFDKKSKDIVANSSGGELAHIATVYQVLDATDPAKAEAAQIKARARMEKESQKFQEEMKTKPDPSLQLPFIPPTWTLDSAAAVIPESRLMGSSAGVEFKPDTNRFDQNGAARILAFQQGVGTSNDHEVFIYLKLTNNEPIEGRAWNITKDTKAKDAPQIVKRWTVNPKFAPVSKTFLSGYVLQLEFGKPTRDWQPGRIYLALPDTNQTVLAGSFSLFIRSEETDLDELLARIKHR